MVTTQPLTHTVGKVENQDEWRSHWKLLTTEASIILEPGETKEKGCAIPRTHPELWS